MEILQILILIFVIFAFSRLMLRFREKSISRQELIFWSTVWTMVLVVSLIPNITSWISIPLGIGRGIDVIVYLSIVILFYLIFRLYVKSEQTNQELTILVRSMAKDNSFSNIDRDEKIKNDKHDWNNR